MTALQEALVYYDGNRAARYCDIVYQALRNEFVRSQGCYKCRVKNCDQCIHEGDDNVCKICELHCEFSQKNRFCPECGRELKGRYVK